MNPIHIPDSFRHAPQGVEKALLAVVLRHYGLKLSDPSTESRTGREPASAARPRSPQHH